MNPKIAAIQVGQAAIEDDSLIKLMTETLCEIKLFSASVASAFNRPHEGQRVSLFSRPSRRNFSKGQQKHREPDKRKSPPKSLPQTKEKRQSSPDKSGQIQDKSNLKCYSCGKSGYTIWKCPVCLIKSKRKQKNKSLSVSNVPDETPTATNVGKSQVDEEPQTCPVNAEACEQAQSHSDFEDEARWWLTVEIGGYRTRALYDPGASRTVMNVKGLQIANACGRAIMPATGKQAKVADGRPCPLAGYVNLPFTVSGITYDIRVAIMPDLDEECYLGGNFIKAFGTVFDPVENTLFFKGTGVTAELEVAALTHLSITSLTAISFADITPSKQDQRATDLVQLLKIKEVIAREEDDVAASQPPRDFKSANETGSVLSHNAKGDARPCVHGSSGSICERPSAHDKTNSSRVSRKLGKRGRPRNTAVSANKRANPLRTPEPKPAKSTAVASFSPRKKRAQRIAT